MVLLDRGNLTSAGVEKVSATAPLDPPVATQSAPLTVPVFTRTSWFDPFTIVEHAPKLTVHNASTNILILSAPNQFLTGSP